MKNINGNEKECCKNCKYFKSIEENICGCLLFINRKDGKWMIPLTEPNSMCECFEYSN